MGDEVLSEAGCGAIEIAAPPQQRVEVDAEPEAVARLRNAARAFARAHGATGDLPGDIALAVTEAATNAILHAYLDREPGTITLICEASRHRLRFRVIDDGCGMRPRPDSPGMGIGLSTIGKLASGMDVRSGDDGAGTEVAITFDAPGVRGPFAAPADAREAALLDAASRIAQSAAWPQEGVERLAELLVGEVGDAVTVDVVDDGVLRRLSARVDGDPELSAWLTDSLPPMKPGTATWDALHGRSPAIVVHDPSRRRPMHGPGERLGLDWWVACALPDRNGRALGIVGIGGRGGRRPVPDDRTVALIAEVAERAAGGLAQARVVDDLRATRRRLEGILEALTEAVTVSTADGRVVWANQAAAEMLGATTPDAIVNASPGSVAAAYAMTGEDGRPISPDDLPSRRLLRGEDAPPLVIRAVERATGRARWTRTTARPLDMGSREPLAVNIIEDITAAKRAALRREALEAVGRLLDRADPTSPDTLAAICAVVSPVKADWCAIDLVDGDGELERVAIMHPDPELRRLGWELTRRYPAPPDAVADVLAGEPQLLAHIPVDADQTIARDDEHLELLRRLVLRSALRAPLSGGGRVHGILTLAHAESGRVFDEDDLAFAVDMGRRIGLAVAFARR